MSDDNEEKGLFESITGYKSVGDMFDGGGAGASGDTYGGALGGVSNAISNTFSSGDSSPSSSSNSDGGNNTFIDPYEYLDLRDQGYSDTAAFEASNYDENPSYNIGSDQEAKPNAASASEQAFYDANQNTNISQADYERNKKIAKVLTLVSGPLGLAMGTINKLQLKGILPGSTGSNLPQDSNDVPSNKDNDDRINTILDDPNLTDEQKAQAIQSSLTDMMNAQASEGLADIGLNQVQPMMDYIFNDLTATSNPENMLSDTSSLIGDDRKLNDEREGFSEADEQSGLDPDDPNYQYSERDRDTIGQAGTSGLDAPDFNDPTTYTADTSLSALDDIKNQAQAQTGTVSDNALVDADQIDLEGAFSGVNEDGLSLIHI